MTCSHAPGVAQKAFTAAAPSFCSALPVPQSPKVMKE
jgi:hypothetical protein